MKRLRSLQVMAVRDAVLSAVAGGARWFREIHETAQRGCPELADTTATDRALQWWRLAGRLTWTREGGWVVVKVASA